MDAQPASENRAAIQSGSPPPVAAPVFLLDPGYAPMLDSDAFRQRFAEQNVYLNDEIFYGGCVLLLLAFGLASPILFAITREDLFMHSTIGYSMMLVPIACYQLFKRARSFLRYLRLRRLARHGRLVIGQLLVARRVRELPTDPEENSFIAVEIEYRADLPDGTRIQGKNSRPRDDLLNADLPEAGTTVVVLALDASNHALL